MKISYKVLKSYLPYIEDADICAQKLVMHTAEVEEVHSQKSQFTNMVYGEISKIENHENADSLKVCMVNIGENSDIQIVCGWSNLSVGQGVAVAKIGASVVWHGQWEPIVMKKTSIRGVESNGMICAAEEIWLADIFPAKDEKEIVDLSSFQAKPGTPLCDVLWKNDEILEIDNKAINHRPDLFSYIWIMREISTIYWKPFELSYETQNFSHLPVWNVKNEIPEGVKRYSLLWVKNVSNTPAREEITTIIQAAGHTSKGLLVDASNYSLYFYWQPAHIFDADTIEGTISIRYAKNGEIFVALDEKTYELSEKDIVIADEKKILALWGIIGGKSSAVSDTTKNILIETAHFDQAILRMTGKRLGIRTDSLNIFEKDILPETAQRATALIVKELQKNHPNLECTSYFDSYPKKQEKILQEYDLAFYNKLIGANYESSYVEKILQHLWIQKSGNTLEIPFWRKELTTKADIAEEIARIHGYNNIVTTVPRINLWAIVQHPSYLIKNDIRSFFTARGWFDVYNYSFVSDSLLQKLNMDLHECVPLKNFLSEEATHMRNSLIPNLMKGLEENIRDRKDLKLFEIEKAFFKEGNDVWEKYLLSWVMTSEKEIPYYDLQNSISDFLKTIFVDNFFFENTQKIPKYAHAGRTAKIVARWSEIWVIWEIHPNIAKRFDVEARVAFFEIDISELLTKAYNKTKAKELSNFQENNFDLSFVVEKNIAGREIANTIAGVDKNIIKKVELFDIYENEEKLPGKRSMSFTVYIQSMTGTIDDETKAKLIQEIVSKVEKKGGKLR